MDKINNVLEMYSQLNYGTKGLALTFIAETFNQTKNSIKSNWLLNKEFPNYITNPTKENEDEINKKLDNVISFLQNAIKQQNSK